MPASVLAIPVDGVTLHVVEGGADGAALTISLTDDATGQRLVMRVPSAQAGTLAAFLNMQRLAWLEVEAL